MRPHRGDVGPRPQVTLLEPITTTDPKSAVLEWFARFGAACASVDYETGRFLVAPHVLSFGTKAEVVQGLDHLEQNQWRNVWPNITDFKIDLTSIHAAGEGDTAWGIATWTSTGYDESGKPFGRPGRATVGLERRDGRWLAVHTHFSLNPGTPARTYGKR